MDGGRHYAAARVDGRRILLHNYLMAPPPGWVKWCATWPVGAIYQLNSLLHHLRLRLANVEVPALLIQATHDEQVAPADVDRIYRSIGSRDKRVVRLGRSGHMLLAGPERDAVITHVETFVRRVANDPG
jgi:esterase/lipase